MAHKKKVRIHNIHKVPVDEQAFIKIIRYYYSGDKNIIVHFDNRCPSWGDHWYVSRSKTHHIRISPTWCRFNPNDDQHRDFKNLTAAGTLVRMNDKDSRSRVIITVLHELKHVMQCDKNPIRYAKCDDNQHPDIKNSSLAYELSPLEAEAEGWALLHINRALERYESWT